MKFPLTHSVLAAALVAVAGPATAEVLQFNVDPVHSQVGFKIRHLVAKTPGSFNEFSGTVQLDPENVAGTLKVEGTVQTASIFTNNEKRDGHLRSPDFFNVEEYPTITLVSKGVKKTDGGLRMLADVTMLGVTKEVPLNVEFNGVMTHPFTGAPTTGLDITGKVNRKDFGMVWNKALDAGGVMLGEDVMLDIHLEANVTPEGDQS